MVDRAVHGVCRGGLLGDGGWIEWFTVFFMVDC